MDKRKQPQTEEHRRKIGAAQLGKLNHAFGKPAWNKGKTRVQPPHSDEWKKNHSEMLKGKKPKNLGISFGLSGDKHHNWSGGDNNNYREKNAPRPRPNQCEVCGALGRICLDHDHTTKKFRGWLCDRCNVALGMVKDNSETLLALSEYLKRSRE